MTLAGKRVFITGGSRGIGLEIAKRIAKDGAMIAIAAKTAEPNPKLPGTIFTAAKEIEAAGGKALPLITDIRDESDRDGLRIAIDLRRDAMGEVILNHLYQLTLLLTFQPF